MEDYKTNVAAYDAWQAALRAYLPKTLIIWGKHEPISFPAGVQAYHRDLPAAKLVWLDAGHFVLDENFSRVTEEIKAYLLPKVGG